MKLHGLAALMALSLAVAAHAASDEQKQHAYGVIDRNAQATAIVGDSLFYFGELGMQEHESAKFLKSTLEGIGFSVEVGGAGMPTNVWAQWGSGRPKIVIVTEIDALPEGSQDPASFPRKPLVAGAPGHMEGHNVHGAVAVAAAHALATSRMPMRRSSSTSATTCALPSVCATTRRSAPSSPSTARPRTVPWRRGKAATRSTPSS